MVYGLPASQCTSPPTAAGEHRSRARAINYFIGSEFKTRPYKRLSCANWLGYLTFNAQRTVQDQRHKAN
jgi:hypothetical protein